MTSPARPSTGRCDLCDKPLPAQTGRGRPRRYHPQCQSKARNDWNRQVRHLARAAAELRRLDRGPVPIVDPETEADAREAVRLLREAAAAAAGAGAAAIEAAADRLDRHLRNP